MPTPEPNLRCPHCDGPTSKMTWGDDGTRWEDYWACPCGGWGHRDKLIDYEPEETEDAT